MLCLRTSSIAPFLNLLGTHTDWTYPFRTSTGVTLKKTIAALFVFLLPVALCRAAEPLSVCFALDGTAIQCSDGKILPRADNSNLQGQSIGFRQYVKNIPTLTYANVTEDPAMANEVMKEKYTQEIIIPTQLQAEEDFVSLKNDAKEQELWAWRDVVEAGSPRKLNYNFSFEDVTGRGNVRVFNTKVGVEYVVSENKAVGVEAIRGIQDSQDASAWGKSGKEEKTAQVKYKIFF